MSAVVVAGAATAGLVAGCGSDAPARSVGNFCSTYNSEKQQFETKYASVEQQSQPQSGGQALTDLFMGFESLGDVSVILDKLDKVAPDDIEPDVAAVKTSWNDMRGTLGDEADNAFNPTGMLGAVVKGLLMSAESNGSWTRLGSYVERNCGGG